MNWPVLLLALGAALALRLGFLALHFRDMESLWTDYERRGFQYRLAQSIDLLTILGFGACAVHALWTLKDAQTSVGGRYGAVFVAWFGMALLERLAVHRFPRTNSPQLFLDARVTLRRNLFYEAISMAQFEIVAHRGITNGGTELRCPPYPPDCPQFVRKKRAPIRLIIGEFLLA